VLNRGWLAYPLRAGKIQKNVSEIAKARDHLSVADIAGSELTMAELAKAMAASLQVSVATVERCITRALG